MPAATLIVVRHLDVAGPCEHKAYLSDASVADKKAFEATVRLLHLTRTFAQKSFSAFCICYLLCSVVWSGLLEVQLGHASTIMQHCVHSVGTNTAWSAWRH